MDICIIGTGHVGLVTGACFADLGNKVICVDSDEAKIKNLRKGIMPIYEPGLEELVRRNRKEKRISFTANLKEGVKSSEVIFIAVGTPPKESGEADLSYVENVARQIALAMRGYKLIVEKSTVPVETGRWVEYTVKAHNHPKVKFDVASNPEFLREGSAIHDFMHPDRIVIGVESKRAKDVLIELYRPLGAPIVVTDIKSAEIIKHASNSFLATKISFINAIAGICEKVGADVVKVAEGIGLDKRIGRDFLEAGTGFGGSCLDGNEFLFLGNPSPSLTDFSTGYEKNWSRHNLFALGFDGCRPKAMKVKVLTRREYNGELVKIKTRMGRRLEVTADHPMLVVKEGNLEVKLAKDLHKDDELPLITSMPENEVGSLDLISAAKRRNFGTKIKVRPKQGSFASIKQKVYSLIRCNYDAKYEFFRKNYMWLDVYKSLEKKGAMPLGRDEVLLYTTKGRPTYVPAIVNLNEDFWRLIGYYLAEGSINYEKKKRGLRARIEFHFNHKETEYVKDVCNILETMQIKYALRYKGKIAEIVISSRLLAFLLDEILSCGRDSYTANIPSILFFENKFKKRALLCGLFRGDGSIYFHNNSRSVTITLGTTSKKLANGVLFLLQSFGVVAGYKTQWSKKSTVPAHLIVISCREQVRNFIFFDKESNRLMNKRLDSYKKLISPIGFKKYNGFAGVKVKEIEESVEKKYVYSLEFEKAPHLFVTSGGMVVHNCLPKDLAAFRRIVEKLGLDFELLEAVERVNEGQKRLLVKKVEDSLWNLNGKVIGILGLSYKPDTDDMRSAPSVEIIERLQRGGARIKAFDPQAMRQAAGLLKDVRFCKDPYEAAKGSDALIILTEWNEFKELDLKRVKKLLKTPIIIDGRNIYDPKKMKRSGFKYAGVGRP